MESLFLLHVFMPYNKLLAYMLTIYLNKLELGLDMYIYMYVCIHFSSASALWSNRSFLLGYPCFISDYANTLYSVLFFFRSWRECYIQVLYT